MTLEEAGISLIDCVHKTPAAQATGYPYVAIPQMKDGRIDFSDARRISKSDFEAWTVKAKPQAFDVVLSRRCNPGETAHVPEDCEFALGQNLVLLRSNGTRVHPPLLRWLVRSPDWWDQIGKFINVGAVFNSLRCADVPKFELRIPNIGDQIEIANILGSLDDKIELNRQMNKTLEEMAQAIFKSWFVDFEPVKAKAAAKATGLSPDAIERAAMAAIAGKPVSALDHLPAETLQSLAHKASLFPDAFEDSELGEIPAGWEVTDFGSATECFDSKRIPLSKREREKRPGEYPYYGATSIMDHIDDYIFEGTSLLIGEDGSVTKPDGRPYTQYVWGKYWVNNHAHVLRGSQLFTTEQLYLFIKDTDISSRVTGAVQPKLNQRNMNSIPLVRAPSRIHVSLQETIGPIFEYRKSLEENSATLGELRDTLLPKLLSGELSVSDAQSRAEAVTA